MYSNKILKESDNVIKLILTHPDVGIETNHLDVKMRLILIRFYLVYRINHNEIEILKFWDCRQDPKLNKYLG